MICKIVVPGHRIAVRSGWFYHEVDRRRWCECVLHESGVQQLDTGFHLGMYRTVTKICVRVDPLRAESTGHLSIWQYLDAPIQ